MASWLVTPLSCRISFSLSEPFGPREMSPKKRKLARLADHANHSACSAILRIVREEGIDDLDGLSQRSLKRAIVADQRLETPYGKVVQQVELQTDARPFRWHVVHPAACLTFLATTCKPFERKLEMMLESQKPSVESPWAIILYADETSPGALLKVDNTRKTMLIYWQFRQSGREILSRENNWFLLGLIRTKLLKTVQGGISGALKVLLLKLFFGNNNVRTMGWDINGSEGRYLGRVYARFDCYLADEDALRASWRVFGSSGNLICFFCKNVVRAASGLTEHCCQLVDGSETDRSKFQLHTNQSWYNVCARLESKTGDALTQDEKLFCLHKDMDSLMFCKELRHYLGPISSSMLDFGHTFLANGVAQFEFGNFLACAEGALGLTYSSLDRFARQWHWPAQERNPPHYIFNQARDNSSGGFKAGMSEVLAIYSVLREFVLMCIPANILEAESASLRALCLILDGWGVYQTGEMSVADLDKWMAQMSTHLELFKTAYSALEHSGVKPKHHYAQHMRDNHEKFGDMYSTGVLERKHKAFKEKGVLVTNGVEFEKSVTTLLLNHQVRLMAEPSQFFEGVWLDNPKHLVSEFLPEEGDWQHSRRASNKHMKLSVGDVVMAKFGASTAVAIIQALVSHNHEGLQSFFAVVSKFERVDCASANVWQRSHEDDCLLALDYILGPCVWSHAAGVDRRRVLPPPRVAWAMFS